tara:strand:- start:347 stop:1513 length:1167 start_codon:yes stop_codon:yes gene_type:complete
MTDKLALVLSGGGARGAFEVGVLRWLARERPEFFKQVRIVTGSSVGAINAAYLASHGMTPDSVESLARIWENLKVGELIGFGPRHVLGRLTKWRQRLVDGQVPGQGWLRTEGYENLIIDAVDWGRLNRVVKEGTLDAVAIAATEVRSGRTHIFVSHHEEVRAPIWPFDGSMIGLRTPIGPEHVLASASLPFLFSPVEINGHWFCDGGLRQNTPLSPALRLGANRLLAVSLKKTSVDAIPGSTEFPGFGQLLGKLFNSLFLDRLLWDLDRLSRINTLLACVEELHGKGAIPSLQNELVKRGRRPYQHVDYVGVRPSADIGKIAADMLKPPHQLHTELGFLMRRVLGTGSSGVSDAASYLLFDGAFAKRLMDLGGQDAANCATDIDRLLT